MTEDGALAVADGGGPSATEAPRLARAFASFAFALALAGSALAGYLAVENLQGRTAACTVVHGCATVQGSQYGKLFGIPVSVPGLALYLTLAATALAWLNAGPTSRVWLTLLGFTGALGGFCFSLYLTAIEAFVLEAWCIYCIVSALLMTSLFALWAALVALERRAAGGAEEG